jgi:hypothetical protein
MDIEEYEREIVKPGKNSYWFRHGYRSRLGLSKATADWGKENGTNPWMFKYLDEVLMDTVQEGKMAEIFSNENAKEIIPVFLLHGLTGTRTT